MDALFPNPAALESFRAGLKTRALGHAVDYRAEAGSTNDLCLEAARGGAAHGLLVIADAQTSGRGRRGRTWQAPAGKALLFSVLCRIENLRAERLGWVALAAGQACAEALRDLAGVAAQPKWPNDVVLLAHAPGELAAQAGAPAAIAWKKLGGILCEGVIADAGGGFVVVGIGLNVLQEPHELPPQAKAPPTSVRIESARAIERLALLSGVLARLEVRLDALRDETEFAFQRRELEEVLRDAWSGYALRVSANGREIDGRFEGLDEFGRLRLNCAGVSQLFADAEILGAW